jgi:hypothetical protein
LKQAYSRVVVPGVRDAARVSSADEFIALWNSREAAAAVSCRPASSADTRGDANGEGETNREDSGLDVPLSALWRLCVVLRALKLTCAGLMLCLLLLLLSRR